MHRLLFVSAKRTYNALKNKQIEYNESEKHC